MARYTVQCEHFDRCLSDYVIDWSGIVIGISGSGQTADQMADEVADEADGNEGIPEGVSRDMLRAAVRECLADGARFWPVDGKGNEVDTDAHPEVLERDDDESRYWFRFTIERDEVASRPDDVEYHVDTRSGETRVYKTANEAAGLAVSIALSDGEPVHIDVVCWSEGGAKAYGGDDAVEIYQEDPETSVFDRIVIRAESLGRVA